MPVADSGPTGASSLDSRQLSAGRSRNLSWLKLPSNTRGVPSSPLLRIPRSCWTAGSNRRSWPMPSWTPAAVTAAIAARASSTARRQGLLAEDMPASGRRGHDLLGVEAVRSAQDHGLDLIVGESLLQVGTVRTPGRPRARACASTSTATTARTSVLSSRSATIFWPHHPRPTTAALITCAVKPRGQGTGTGLRREIPRLPMAESVSRIRRRPLSGSTRPAALRAPPPVFGQFHGCRQCAPRHRFVQ